LFACLSFWQFPFSSSLSISPLTLPPVNKSLYCPFNIEKIKLT
jgi:hypothetical protein